jgi:hypothetical protein
MKQYERLVALIKPRQISVANLGGLKASEVVQQVATRLGKKFTLHSHLKCWNTTTRVQRATVPLQKYGITAIATTMRLIRITSILPTWVDFLVGKLSDAATYDLVLKGPPAGA